MPASLTMGGLYFIINKNIGTDFVLFARHCINSSAIYIYIAVDSSE